MDLPPPPRKLRRYRPDFCFARIEDIPVAGLTALGIRGLLLDVDNTLNRWDTHDVSDSALQWLAAAHDAGLQLRLLSNGLAVKRAAVAAATGIEQVGGPLFKPIHAFYRAGLKQMGLTPEQTMMVGDSVFTDIAGANRCGIWTALLEPIGSVDFVGTKLYRLAENWLKLRRPLCEGCDYR